MPVRYEFRCPSCHDVFGHSISGLTSGLGTPALRCRACGNVFDSCRREWAAYTPPQKYFYLGVSLAYALFLGFTAQPITRIIGWAVGDLERLNVELPMSNFWKWSGMATVAGAVLLYQGARVLLSIRRTDAEGTDTIRKTSYFSFAHNGHYWWLGSIMVAIVVVFFTVHLLGLPKAHP